MHLVSTIDEVLALALQPVSSDVSSRRLDAQTVDADVGDGSRSAARPASATSGRSDQRQARTRFSRSTISPALTIACASATVNGCDLDVLVLVRLARRIGRRRPQLGHSEENQFLVAEARRGKRPRMRSTRPRHQADFFLALPRRRLFGRFAGVDAARRQLPQLAVDARAGTAESGSPGRRRASE